MTPRQIRLLLLVAGGMGTTLAPPLHSGWSGPALVAALLAPLAVAVLAAWWGADARTARQIRLAAWVEAVAVLCLLLEMSWLGQGLWERVPPGRAWGVVTLFALGLAGVLWTLGRAVLLQGGMPIDVDEETWGARYELVREGLLETSLRSSVVYPWHRILGFELGGNPDDPVLCLDLTYGPEPDPPFRILRLRRPHEEARWVRRRVRGYPRLRSWLGCDLRVVPRAAEPSVQALYDGLKRIAAHPHEAHALPPADERLRTPEVET